MGKGSLVPSYAKHTLSLCQAEKLRLKKVKDKTQRSFVLLTDIQYWLLPSVISSIIAHRAKGLDLGAGSAGGICLSVWVFVCSVSVAVLLCSPGLAWNYVKQAGHQLTEVHLPLAL